MARHPLIQAMRGIFGVAAAGEELGAAVATAREAGV
jgi:hypothetical protein